MFSFAPLPSLIDFLKRNPMVMLLLLCSTKMRTGLKFLLTIVVI
nr:MAG TPA: hypothetical protein [Caudoviricetes sp.]